MSISETHLAVSIVDIPYEVFTGTLLEYLDIPGLRNPRQSTNIRHPPPWRNMSISP